jgi:heme exporter protein C
VKSFDQFLFSKVFYCNRVMRNFGICSLAFVLGTLIFVLTLVPGEAVMGAVQRTFYFHVSSAVACYLCVVIMFFSGTRYLFTRDQRYEKIGIASAVTGFMFASAVLMSGMIWGHSAWNTWWRWEPRLVSFLVLWMLLGSYVLVGKILEGDARRASILSVIGVVATIQVPVIVFSIRLFAERLQLHPQVLAASGLTLIEYKIGLYCGMISLSTFAFWNILCRLRIEECEARIQQLEGQFYGS